MKKLLLATALVALGSGAFAQDSIKIATEGAYEPYNYIDQATGKLVGFELYAVLPYTKSRCLRSRLGWKIMSRRFRDEHYAQLVNTFNPFDGYGDNT